MAEIRGESLQQIFHDIVLAGPHHRRRVVRISQLRPRDVTAVTAVVRVAKKVDSAWKIYNAEPVRRLEKAVGLLLALESAVLPTLHTFPDMPSMVGALRSYTDLLSIDAAATGGQFNVQAQELCVSLRDYIQLVDAEEEEAAGLRTRVTALNERVTDLLNADITISQARGAIL